MRKLIMKKAVFFTVSAFIICVLMGCASLESKKTETMQVNARDVGFNGTYIERVWRRFIVVNQKFYCFSRLIDNPEYDKLEERLQLGGPFTFYYIPDRKNDKIDFIITKIDGLISIEEFDAYVAAEAERRVIVVNLFSFFLTDWQKAFGTKEEAISWYNNSANRARYINDVVSARQKLYEDNVRAFRALPTRIMLNTITRNKNDLIEAYNRYQTFYTEIGKTIEKGVFFEELVGIITSSTYQMTFSSFRIAKRVTISRAFFIPTEEVITQRIENINREFARLVDTFPVQ